VKKLLYHNDEVALYFDEDSATFIEYNRVVIDGQTGLGIKHMTKPLWYERIEKLNALLQSQPAIDVCNVAS